MTQEEVLQAFKDTGALLEGHFELRSKLHSNRYFQCANVLRYPRIAARLCEEVVSKMKAERDIGVIDGVISPAVGGILVGHEVARQLDTKCVFAEKVQG
jgi:orotate phosphoribosyltransferase